MENPVYPFRFRHRKEEKWQTQKKKKTGLPKAGKHIINPEWLEDKYDVTIERRHSGRATHGYGKAYLKGGKVK